jgi:hypothetical protein
MIQTKATHLYSAESVTMTANPLVSDANEGPF